MRIREKSSKAVEEEGPIYVGESCMEMLEVGDWRFWRGD